MLVKTKGIVLKHFKYSETSIIVKIFTREFGLQGYIINGIRSKRSKGKIALYQPLTILDMLVYHKKNTNISRISESRCPEPFDSIPYEIKKSAVGIFIGEVLYKVIKEGEQSRELFEFVSSSISIFDHLQSNYNNFHLQFLLKLSKYLGFGIENAEVLILEEHLNHEVITKLLNESFGTPIVISNITRKQVLDDILIFYQRNLDSFSELKSVKVLREIF